MCTSGDYPHELVAAPSGEAPPEGAIRPSIIAASKCSAVPFWQDPLLRQSLVLTVATAVLNGSNWLYHMVMSRTLGPAGYGGLSSLLGLVLLLTVPVNTIQMGLSAFVAGAQANGEEAVLKSVLVRSLRGFLLLGIAAFVVLGLLSGWLARVLQLGTPMPVLITATVLISWAVLPVLRGILQGMQRFGPLGVSLATEGVLKLGAGALLVMLGLGLNGAVAGVSLGAAGALGLTLLVIPMGLHGAKGDGEMEWRGLLRSLAPYAMAIGCFTVLTQGDVVLVKALFPPREAGLYAAASTGGKIILYLTAGLPMVMLPEMARRHAVNEDGRSIFMRGALLGGLVGGAAVAVYLLAPAAVIRILFGGAYLEAGSLLWILGVAMLFYQLALMGVYFQLGRHHLGFIRPMMAVTGAFPLLVWLSRGSSQSVAMTMAGLGMLTFLSVWCFDPGEPGWRTRRQIRLKASGM